MQNSQAFVFLLIALLAIAAQQEVQGARSEYFEDKDNKVDKLRMGIERARFHFESRNSQEIEDYTCSRLTELKSEVLESIEKMQELAGHVIAIKKIKNIPFRIGDKLYWASLGIVLEDMDYNLALGDSLVSTKEEKKWKKFTRGITKLSSGKALLLLAQQKLVQGKKFEALECRSAASLT